MKKILLFLTAISSLYAAPQAVVFDFGGVMTGKDNREAVVEFLRQSFHFSREEFDKVNIEKHKAIKLGKTDVEFWLDYAKQKGIELSQNWPTMFKATLKDALGVNHEMYLLVEQIKEKKIPVALFSNIDERLGKLICEFGLYEPFNPCLLSYQIGNEKPALEAYRILLKKLTLPAQDVLFIDDKPENVAAAKQLGIDAVQFESIDQLRDILKKRGVF